MMHKFRLKEFRIEHKVLQADLAELWGVNQATISRMEMLGKNLTDLQYDLLGRKYGEDVVSCYVDRQTVQNVMGRSRRRPAEAASDDALAIIREQQQEIAWLNKRIEELTNMIINNRMTKGG